MSDLSRRQLLGAFTLVPFLAKDQDPVLITDNVSLVLLDVSVKDKAGSYVTGLSKGDFHVLDDGKPVPVSHFESSDAPVTVGLIVDNSGSMRSKRPGVILAGLSFARESNPQDEFFVINFNDRVVKGLPAHTAFTDNMQQLHKALFMGDVAGKTALYDAIAEGLRHLETGHHAKRTLIIVSDGGDNASHVTQSNLLTMIQESRASVYTVGLMDPESTDLRPAVLRRIASLSGAEYFQPESAEEVMTVLHKISQDIRHRYTVGFVPAEEKSGRSSHNIKVTANRAGRRLMVRTRTSYILAPV